MSIYGANPEQLAGLGRSLTNQIQQIDAIVSTVNSALAGTTWMGPARDRFEQDWNGTFRGALNRLGDAFRSAGQDCLNRSQELQRVMGAG